jgi:hypothetical protein
MSCFFTIAHADVRGGRRRDEEDDRQGVDGESRCFVRALNVSDYRRDRFNKIKKQHNSSFLWRTMAQKNWFQILILFCDVKQRIEIQVHVKSTTQLF